MTKKNLSDVTLLLDRTGSMASIQSDVVGGVNAFIEEQKKADGEANFTLIQFDSVDPNEVIYDCVSIEKVEEFKNYIPRSTTPLLDAVGTTIANTGQRLSNIKEEDRPSQVVIVVFTDGYENASKEYSREKIREMVKHQTSVYKWQFVFLGADIDAFAEGGSMGFSGQTTSGLNKNKVFKAMKNVGNKVGKYRSNNMASSLHYSNEDRESLK